MVNIPQGGMSLHTPGRGPAPRAGIFAPGAAGHAEAADSTTRTAPAAASVETRPSPPAQPAQQAARNSWPPARLIATLLRILTTPGIAGGPQHGPRAGADPSFPGQAPAAAPPTPAPASESPASTRLMAMLLRVVAGGTAAPRPAQTGSAAAGTPAERPAEATQPAPQPRAAHELVAAGVRSDLHVPPAGAGAPAATTVPPGAPAAAGEHPSPRAELVPPGDGVRRRNSVDLPIVPAALVALALPALAAVLASLF